MVVRFGRKQPWKEKALLRLNSPKPGKISSACEFFVVVANNAPTRYISAFDLYQVATAVMLRSYERYLSCGFSLPLMSGWENLIC